MKSQLSSRRSYLPVLLLLVMALLIVPTWAAAPQRQPHMEAALGHLRQAEEELQKAEPNKGGHRERAMEMVQRAEKEVQGGIEYFDTHEKH
jgi:hypothetical protein